MPLSTNLLPKGQLFWRSEGHRKGENRHVLIKNVKWTDNEKLAANSSFKAVTLTTIFDSRAYLSNQNLPHGPFYISCSPRQHHEIVHRLLTDHKVEVKTRKRSTIGTSMSKPY